MSSDAQIAANRLNAEKSTGPTSVEGKANSRFNSLKTGLYAKSAVLPGEEAAEREALAEAFRERFQPKTPEQAFLVEELIRGNWIPAASAPQRGEPVAGGHGKRGGCRSGPGV